MGSGSESEKLRLEKLGKLCALLKVKQAECYEIQEEMARILGGAAGIGATLKRLQEAFDAAWCHRYAPGQTKAYVWQWAKDTTLFKRLLKNLAPEEIERRMINYLKSEDPFFAKNRHTFGLFVSSVNQFADFDRTLHEELPPPAGCTHLPPCRSDQEHTRRRSEDMRTGNMDAF
jgi:hypothetical protein